MRAKDVDARAAAIAAAQREERPGWGIVLFLFGVPSLVIGWTDGPWNWWALLWVPLYLVGIGAAVHEWRLLARLGRQLPFVGWAALVTAHLSALFALGLATGVLTT
ncbi:hypothetical protein ACFYVL_43430 [Streptomyces sp. NPDC004111]|uniref:hypothetical protein n=1 Tax=Streptomyces sp. NPDC004111 TaxID=3364690 RepID=UPI00367F3D81